MISVYSLIWKKTYYSTTIIGTTTILLETNLGFNGEYRVSVPYLRCLTGVQF